MNWIYQSVLFVVIGIVCGLGTRFVAGEYDRGVQCEPATLKSYEVCMVTVQDDWQGDVLWIDARGRKPGKELVDGALEISETHLTEDLGKTAQLIFKANNESQKVVIFCETDACGSSKYVRGKILENMLHQEVYILHGGWKAYQAGMKD